MDLVIDLAAWRSPFVAIGIGYLALAAWLLVLDFPNRLNRAFALYLFLEGGRQLFRIFDPTTPDGAAMGMEAALMSVAAPYALVYFMLTYGERFGARKWRARALVPLVLVAVLLSGAVLYEPSWYGEDRLGPIGSLTSWLDVLTPCVAALLFGREATQHVSEAPRRHALLLASLAFAAGPLFSALHLLIPNLMSSTASAKAAQLAALLPLGLLVLHMARVARGRHDDLRFEARRFLLALSLPAGSVLVFMASALASRSVALWVMSGLMSVWTLALPLLVTYALVRHRLFDIDVKLRWGISKSTIAAAFIAAFFLASEGAQILFGQGNEWIGLLAAGALVFALAPLQRAAERLAEKAVPTVGVAPAPAGAEATFRAAVARLLRDGALSREDERLLAHLTADLGIDPRRAYEVREAVEAEALAEARK